MSDHQVPTTHGAASSDKPWWATLLMLCSGLLSAFGGVYWATHDTPPLRAANDAISLHNDGQAIQVELEKERTKQMKIAARSAGSLQPLVAPRSRPQLEQQLLSQGEVYKFQGDGSSVSSVIGLSSFPVSMTGAFKLYGCGSTAWSSSWSSDPSPTPLDTFVSRCASDSQVVKWIEVYSKGQSMFNM